VKGTSSAAHRRHTHLHGIEMLAAGGMEETDDVALDPEALGRLRRELLWSLGEIPAHGIMARLGFSCGQTDLNNPPTTPFTGSDAGRLGIIAMVLFGIGVTVVASTRRRRPKGESA